jgi:serine/threonine protein kinase
VAYCRGESEITPASDIFQLALVIAEVFTGMNPLKAAQKILDPIEMSHLGPVPGSQGAAIRGLIERMLIDDPLSRPKAHDLLDSWEGVFLEVVKVSHQLEGTVF